MSYNQLAEQWATEPAKTALLFCDLADETPTDRTFTIGDLVGNLPCLKHYAPSTQGDILRAFFIRAASEDWPGDGLTRVQRGLYRWRFHDWSAD